VPGNLNRPVIQIDGEFSQQPDFKHGRSFHL
jgi:hypothetical protein